MLPPCFVRVTPVAPLRTKLPSQHGFAARATHARLIPTSITRPNAETIGPLPGRNLRLAPRVVHPHAPEPGQRLARPQHGGTVARRRWTGTRNREEEPVTGVAS